MEDLSNNLGVYLHAEKKATGQFGHTPHHPFVVTKVTCHKEQSTLLGHQHIYVLLKIQPHPSQPQPSWSHTCIKVYQKNKGNPLLAHLGLYPSSEGQFTIIDNLAAQDKIIYQGLSWSLEQAPNLYKIFFVIIKVGFSLKQGWFKSCNIFAAAILDAIYDIYGDNF